MAGELLILIHLRSPEIWTSFFYLIKRKDKTTINYMKIIGGLMALGNIDANEFLDIKGYYWYDDNGIKCSEKLSNIEPLSEDNNKNYIIKYVIDPYETGWYWYDGTEI